MIFTPYGDRLEPETVTAVLGIEWEEKTTVFQHRPQTGLKHQDILTQYKRGRELFLDGGFDALLVIESDIIPPPGTLRKLADLKADYATGVYVYRHGFPVLNVRERYPGKSRNQGESLTHQPQALKKALIDTKIDCSGGGLGCSLVKRHVLKDIPFRLGESADCDFWFNRDIWKAGYSMKADMSVICGHKKPDGEILWPEYAQISV